MSAFVIPQTVALGAENQPKFYAQPLVYGNQRAHRWRITVRDGKEEASLSGYTATLYVARQDAKTIRTDEGITISGGTIEAVIPPEAYAVEGKIALEIDLAQGDEIITCAKLGAVVRRSRTDNIVLPGEGEIYDLEALLAQISAVKAATEAANTAAGSADAAALRAGNAAEAADDATEAANAAADSAGQAALLINGLTVGAVALDTGQAPTATVSEVAGHYHVALGLPRGLTGATPQISVEVETGLPGSNAQVSVTGTAEAPVIHLTIPRGDTGNIENMPFSAALPEALGEASPGTSESVARANHIHPMPSAADVGAYAAGSIRVQAISLATSAWTGSGPYTAVIARADVTEETWVDIRFDAATAGNQRADIEWSTEPGQITLTTDTLPAGTLSGQAVMMEVG